jgi:hypothetical protein
MSVHGIMVRWQLLGLRNAILDLLRERGGEVLVVGGLALLLLGGFAFSLYQSLEREAPAIRAAWAMVAGGGAGVALGVGWRCGRASGKWAGRQAAASWLTVLPMAEAARFRAARVASLAVGGALLPLPALCGWGVSHAVAAPHATLAAPAMALCFAVGFVAAGQPARWSATEVGRAGRVRRVALMWRLVAKLDGMAPRHVGIWAQGDGGRELSRSWLALMVAVGPFAACMTVVQARSWPALVAAVVGANLVCLAGLRGEPLRSPVLRCLPVSFARAWWGVARGPVALAFLWFGVAVLPAMAVSGGAWRQVLGAAGVLLALNALVLTAVAVCPGSRRQGAVLYAMLLGAVLYQGAQYGVAFGGLAAAAMTGVAILLWRQARRRFRGGA